MFNSMQPSKTLNEYSRELVDKTLNSKMDPSTKNKLYNQRLMSYIKHKKEEDRKPVRVALDDETFGQIQSVKKEPEILNQILDALKTKRESPEPKSSEPKSPEPKSPEPKKESKEPKKEPIKELPKRVDREKIGRELRGILNKNRAKFRIHDDIVRDDMNKEIKGSSVEKIIDNLVNSKTTSTLKGETTLMARLRSENDTQHLIKKLLRIGSPIKTRKQRGFGRIRIKIWKF